MNASLPTQTSLERLLAFGNACTDAIRALNRAATFADGLGSAQIWQSLIQVVSDAEGLYIENHPDVDAYFETVYARDGEAS